MIKGYIEGYYGAILSWKDRKAILNLLPKLNLNSYLYCPKEDPKHRIQWKLDYSVDELNNFKEISELANKNKVNFIFGISPGNEEPIDFDKLANKIGIFREIGFKNFCILFDDLLEPGNPINQANTLNNCRESFQDCTFYLVPEIYANSLSNSDIFENKYLKDLFSNIDDKPNIFWTGKKVISNKYDYEEIKKLEDFYNLNIYIWDNFYASDYCEPRVTLDKYLPFTGNIPSDISGIMINATGKINLDLLILRLYSLGFQRNDFEISDFLSTELHPAFKSISKYFTFNGSLIKADDCEYVNDILQNWIHPIKNEIYPYLHLLKFLMQNTGSRDSNFIKRIRLKERES